MKVYIRFISISAFHSDLFSLKDSVYVQNNNLFEIF